MTKLIHVTSPFLPDIGAFTKKLEKIWISRILTNSGELHCELEKQLIKILGISEISLINNGTIALQIALTAFRLKGQVITTPFSFVATANSILLSGLEPVFVDIEDNSFNIDPELIEKTSQFKTSAIMPVHVYGLPCDKERIEEFAGNRGLKVIYDAAHAFNVRRKGESILNWGDCSVLSFHATKVYHTFEGGGIVTSNVEYKDAFDKLRNFGFSQGDVEICGTNGKMNEAQAAMGLALLPHIDDVINMRKLRHNQYCDRLRDLHGITVPSIPSNVDHNYGYFPILMELDSSVSRDTLFDMLQRNGIFARKYFFPLITDFTLYMSFKIISKHKVSNARRIADRVLCLPLYPDLTESDVDRICNVIRQSFKRKQ